MKPGEEVDIRIDLQQTPALREGGLLVWMHHRLGRPRS